MICIVISQLSACKSLEAGRFDFPNPIDTSSKEIQMQEKGEFYFRESGVSIDNTFDGARMNGAKMLDSVTLLVSITPENAPINPSPFYSFRVSADKEKEITLILDYLDAKHRYYPKVSDDGETWQRLPESDVQVAENEKTASLKLKLSPEKLWVSGQELMNSTYTKNWCEELATDSRVRFSSIGKSKLGRDLYLLDIYEGEKEKKETVVILGRQHPPEISGYIAMEAFVEEILGDSALSKAFVSKFRILVFPLMNPDGVDLGHWRHNAGGIDLNRDWSKFRQPETRQVADYMVAETTRSKNKVLLGLDFHSTHRDVYYTMDESMPSVINGFKDYWLDGIDDAFADYKPEDAPSGLTRPISKGWFYLQFGAESITYEIGDHTPRDFIRAKGSVSAKEMMKLLILRN
ncbi:MAG: M14 family metallopeptidase [Bacteroidota bacterium]